MKRVVVLLLCAVMVLGVFAGCGDQTKAPAAFSVGYGKADITYDKGSVNMTGMGDDDTRFTNGVLDKIYATCVACTDTKGNTVLMFGVDLLNTYGELFADIRQTISNETGIPFDNIMFGASHTHSGPTQKGDTPAIQESNALIKERCIQAAKDAIADMAPAKMYTTFARPEGLNFVRHYVLADGSYLGKRTGHVAKTDLIGHPHKADNLLQLVKFAREGDKKDVIMINWQAHYHGASNVNYNGISADYPGALRAELEAQLDCLSSFYLGGSGNLTSTSQIPSENTSKDYKEHGKRLAAYAVEAAANFKEAKTGDIFVASAPLSYKNNGVETEGPVLNVIGFGEFGIAWAPFEIFDTNARNVREASPFKYTFYASCANAGTGNMYLPDAAGFTYPTYEALGGGETDNPKYTRFPQGTGELVQDQLIDLLKGIFTKTGSAEQVRDEGYLTPEFVPVSDGVTYTNPTAGDMSAIRAGDNGLYCFALFVNGKAKNMLAANKEIAEQVMAKATVKLIFDERNVIVGIAE